MTKTKQTPLEKEMAKKIEKQLDNTSIEIGREDVIVNKETRNMELRLKKAISSVDCYVKMDLLGMFVLTGLMKEIKQEGIKQGKTQANNDMTDHLEASYQRGRQAEQERILNILKPYKLVYRMLAKKIKDEK